MEIISPVVAALSVALLFLALPVYGQPGLPPCTPAMLTSFTPCMNFLSNATANVTTPTPDCCNTLKSLTTNSSGCLCLLVTGSVPPFPVPIAINRTLAISLPQACNMPGVPVRCKASTTAPIPAPGARLMNWSMTSWTQSQNSLADVILVSASYCASGAVANVTVRQPSPNSSSTVTFHGHFDILSLSAMFLTPTTHSNLPTVNLNVAISLSIPQGQIIGGIVAGPLTAAGTVYAIAASFSSPSFQRLPVEDEATRNNNNNTTASGGHDQQSPSGASGDNNNNSGGGGEPGAAIYSCNLFDKFLWSTKSILRLLMVPHLYACEVN